jgi:hypothetical protein
VEENLSNRFKELNEGIGAFTEELKKMGLWNNVVTIQTSDFARTLHPNSGDGTGKFFYVRDSFSSPLHAAKHCCIIVIDHAWGGNCMMITL